MAHPPWRFQLRTGLRFATIAGSTPAPPTFESPSVSDTLVSQPPRLFPIARVITSPFTHVTAMVIISFTLLPIHPFLAAAFGDADRPVLQHRFGHPFGAADTLVSKIHHRLPGLGPGDAEKGPISLASAQWQLRHRYKSWVILG